jgi:hypothetical protein
VANSEVPGGPVRRTQRLYVALPLIVRGPDFRETGSTVAVNANGCLVMLKAVVAMNDQIWLINPKTAEELPATVVSLGKRHDGKTSVGIEFTESSPLFWRITFPPDDWQTSADRKRSSR